VEFGTRNSEHRVNDPSAFPIPDLNTAKTMLNTPRNKSGMGRVPHLPTIILSLAVILAGLLVFIKALYNPSSYILVPEGGAEWIRYPERSIEAARRPGNFFTVFRKRFRVEAAPDRAILEVRAFRNAAVLLDDRMILPMNRGLESWKESRHIDITRGLTPGEHIIAIATANRNAHPAALAYCREIGLFTGPGWEASRDGELWLEATSVEDTIPADITLRFPRTDDALLSCIPYLLPLFIIVFVFTMLWPRDGLGVPRIGRFILSANGIRWLIMLALCVLGINDAIAIPVGYGFDAGAHMKYVKYVAEKHRLPLATEGWMMFHTPLYYIVSAFFYVPLSKYLAADSLEKVLRLISIAAGVLQVELTYRSLKRVFPEREDLQGIGTIIGGLIPMKLYSSQVVGNEAFAGCATSLVLLMCFSLIRAPEARTRCFFPVMGLSLGLAILSKMTAIMLVPPMFLLLFHLLYSGEGPAARANLARTATALITVFGIAFLVSGWFFARNRLLLGAFNIGDWNQNIYVEYWQDPSYRSLGQFYKFGHALVRPIYSGVYGLWDALYSTFWADAYPSGVLPFESRISWNYSFMFSGVLLAVLPSLAIIIGILRALLRPLRFSRDGSLFAVLVVAVYTAGFIYHTIMVPFFSGVKATYLEGLVPCFAILAAGGLDLMMRRHIFRSLVYAFIACWAFAAYLTYFVI